MASIKVEGFNITANGDPSVGILSARWELKNGFFFDTIEDLEEFREELSSLFEGYCGEKVYVNTFEEYQQRIVDEQKYGE